MKKLLLLSIVLMLGATLFAGSPHSCIWYVYEGAGGPFPADLEFTAWIEARPGEILDQTDVGSNYFPDTGNVVVQVGNFATQWDPGDVLIIDNVCDTQLPYDYHGQTSGVLTTAGFDLYGDYVYGDMDKVTLKELWNSHRVKKFRNFGYNRQTPLCKKCGNVE